MKSGDSDAARQNPGAISLHYLQIVALGRDSANTGQFRWIEQAKATLAMRLALEHSNLRHPTLEFVLEQREFRLYQINVLRLRLLLVFLF